MAPGVGDRLEGFGTQRDLVADFVFQYRFRGIIFDRGVCL
jgi:hypothetical protein